MSVDSKRERLGETSHFDRYLVILLIDRLCNRVEDDDGGQVS